jgi:hypothetical protein
LLVPPLLVPDACPPTLDEPPALRPDPPEVEDDAPWPEPPLEALEVPPRLVDCWELEALLPLQATPSKSRSAGLWVERLFIR